MPFVGREEDLASIADLLADPACRLLTLVGPGGIGKTRLALESAGAHLAAYPDGAFFVPLEALDEAALLVSEIACTLDCPLHEGGDPRQQLCNYFRDKTLLLVLDNFEHLLDGADLVSDLLAHAPGVQVMATSREALNLQEEWLWQVGGMHYPTPDGDGLRPDDLESYSAVRLFVQHARQVRPDFSLAAEAADVIRICALVEGMPLGLELAAAWLRVLSCGEIVREIGRNLDFLATRARNVPPRHRSMRAVLDSSWDLLTGEERRVYCRLSVFRGGFTREAVLAVAGASLPMLSALVDKSLLRREANGRCEMHALLKQYAEEHLRADLEDTLATHDRHCAYFTGYLHQQWAHLQGSRSKEALEAIEDEIDNVRMAWHWAVVHRQEAQLSQALDSLWFFYDTRSRYREGEQALARAVEVLGADGPDAGKSLLLGRVLARLGVLYNSLYLPEKATALLEEGLALARRFAARQEIAFALTRLGETLCFTNRRREAERHLSEGLETYRALGDAWGAAYALNWLGNVASWRGQEEEARRFHLESYSLFNALGNRWGVAVVLCGLSYHALHLGDYEEAEQYARDGLAACQDIGIRWGIAMSLDTLGVVITRQGRYGEAEHFLKQSIKTATDLQLDHIALSALADLAMVLARTGQQARAVEWLALARRQLRSVKRVEKNLAANVLNQLKAELPADDFAAAVERGEALDFEAVIRALLAETPAPQAAGADGAAHPAQPLADPLTARELEILNLVAAGHSNRAIAEALFLAPGTVKWYLSQTYSKLGVNSRTQAVAQARALHLL